jgi:hypothetical protein
MKGDETNLRKKNIVEGNEQKWIESGSMFFNVFHKLCIHNFLFLGDNISQDFVSQFFLFFLYVFLLFREFH